MTVSTSPRHAELVSASMPHCSCKSDTIRHGITIEAWVLKQVQDDGEGVDESVSDFAAVCDEERLDHFRPWSFSNFELDLFFKYFPIRKPAHERAGNKIKPSTRKYSTPGTPPIANKTVNATEAIVIKMHIMVPRFDDQNDEIPEIIRIANIQSQ